MKNLSVITSVAKHPEAVITSEARDLLFAPSRHEQIPRSLRVLVTTPFGMLLVMTAIAMLLVTTASAQAPRAFTRADTASLHRTLDGIAAAHRGVLGYSVNNLDTGERLSLRGDETFPTASLIKVPILVTLYDLAEQKQLSLDDPLTVLKIDQVPGSGVLQYMRPGMTLTVNDAASLMTILSDNTATNLLLDRIVIRRVWQKMEALGLPHTKVHSKTFLRMSSVAMDSSVKYGLGVSTPNEMARLFELLANGKAVSTAADSMMLAILGNNTDGELMQRTIDGMSVPHKTGATDSVRTECALFRLQSRVVACGFTKQNADTRWIVDNEAQLSLGKLAAAIVNAWPKK
ncbi:MAG TPA: serine hydrolase [Gemmatimonadaceae bacterium]